MRLERLSGLVPPEFPRLCKATPGVAENEAFENEESV